MRWTLVNVPGHVLQYSYSGSKEALNREGKKAGWRGESVRFEVGHLKYPLAVSR